MIALLVCMALLWALVACAYWAEAIAAAIRRIRYGMWR